MLEVREGAATSHVAIDVGGAIIFASITNEASAQLGIAKDRKARTVFKASDVMVAFE